MSMIVDYLEGRGIKTKKKKPNEYTSACPKCGGDDRFIVWLQENKFWCRGCEWSGDYIQLLMDLDGMSFREAADKAGKRLDAPPPRRDTGSLKRPEAHPTLGRPDTVFTYTNAEGKPVFYICRFNAGPKRKKKVFSVFGPKGWKTEGIGFVPYNLVNVIKNRIIYFVEGEKCVEALRKCGLCATTTACGTDALNWQVKNSDVLKAMTGKVVFIIPDQDDPGKKYAKNVAEHISGEAGAIKILQIPVDPGEDIADYFEKNGPEQTRLMVSELCLLTKPWDAPSETFTMTELLDEKFVETEDIIEDFFPQGSHILIAGEAGVGKSLLRQELSLHLAYGIDWIGHKIPKKHRVAIFQYENSEPIEQKRFKGMLKGMNLKESTSDLVYINRANMFDLTLKGDRKKLHTLVEKLNVDIIIYDCLSNMHSGRENKNSEMRSVLDTFVHINAEYNTSCIVIHHFGKPNFEGAMDNRYRIRGASAIVDWAVSAMTLTEFGKYEGMLESKDIEPSDYRKVEFVKLRDHAPMKPLWLERQAESLLMKVCPMQKIGPLTVQRVIKNLGGKFEGTNSEIESEIQKALGVTKGDVKVFIRNAINDNLITMKNTGRNKVEYEVTEGEIDYKQERKPEQGKLF